MGGGETGTGANRAIALSTHGGGETREKGVGVEECRAFYGSGWVAGRKRSVSLKSGGGWEREEERDCRDKRRRPFPAQDDREWAEESVADGGNHYSQPTHSPAPLLRPSRRNHQHTPARKQTSFLPPSHHSLMTHFVVIHLGRWGSFLDIKYCMILPTQATLYSRY